jgi:hypothetical protein
MTPDCGMDVVGMLEVKPDIDMGLILAGIALLAML